MPSATSPSAIQVEPFTPPAGSKINFGATVSNVDVENLTGKTGI